MTYVNPHSIYAGTASGAQIRSYLLRSGSQRTALWRAFVHRTHQPAFQHSGLQKRDGGIRNKAARGELRRGLPVGFVFRSRRHRPACLARFAESHPPTMHSTKSSRIRCMLAHTRTARPGTNATSMNRVWSESGHGICPWSNGPFSSGTTILVLSIGPPSRPTKRGSIPTRGRSLIRREEP